jgi:S-adenosylmethionine hydrolase
MTAPDPRRPIITLTTDFGLSDTYVAEMKAVILQIAPGTAVIDVSHEVRPQAVMQALYMTQRAWPHFPQGAVHVAVVDPGVGSDRVALALRTPQGFFVGPDNGVLSAALPDVARPTAANATPIDVPTSVRAVAITAERYMRMPVSATFHGRDVFAPAAAHLACGVAIEELGPPMQSVLAYGPLRAKVQPD